MAYESKVTNKYFGTTFAGSGKVGVEETELSGLVKALGNSLPQLQEMGNQYITGQQKGAELEPESLNASGKSLEDIQQIINSGENDELSSMYATVTNDMWVGKTTAIQDWNSVIADYDNYDPKAQSAEEFVNEYITADFDRAGKHFTGAYASVWNEKKAAFLMKDAQDRFELKNKEEKDSMTAFVMSYKATENDITFYERLETKIQSDGKPPTNAQINAVAYQAVEQFIEAGDYDSAEEFLKTSRGYNGKMEVKSLYASGSAKAADLMKQIRDGRNALTVKEAAAAKIKYKKEFSELLYQSQNGKKSDGTVLTEEEKAEVMKSLNSAKFIADYALIKKVFDGYGDTFGNTARIEKIKVELTTGKFYGQGTGQGWGDLLKELAIRGITLTDPERAELYDYHQSTSLAYNENVNLLNSPRLKTFKNLLKTTLVTSKTGSRKVAEEQAVLDLIYNSVDSKMQEFYAAGNFPPSKNADPKVKLAYDETLNKYLDEVQTEIQIVFDNQVVRDATSTMLYSGYEYNNETLEKLQKTQIEAITKQASDYIDNDTINNNSKTNEIVPAWVETSKNTLEPIPDVIRKSEMFEALLNDRSNKISPERYDNLVASIMEKYGLEDNTADIMNARRELQDRISSTTISDIELPELDVSFFQDVIELFNDDDEERQELYTQKFQETISTIIGMPVTYGLLNNLPPEDKQKLADVFKLGKEEFRTAIRSLRNR